MVLKINRGRSFYPDTQGERGEPDGSVDGARSPKRADEPDELDEEERRDNGSHRGADEVGQVQIAERARRVASNVSDGGHRQWRGGPHADTPRQQDYGEVSTNAEVVRGGAPEECLERAVEQSPAQSEQSRHCQGRAGDDQLAQRVEP